MTVEEDEQQEFDELQLLMDAIRFNYNLTGDIRNFHVKNAKHEIELYQEELKFQQTKKEKQTTSLPTRFRVVKSSGNSSVIKIDANEDDLSSKNSESRKRNHRVRPLFVNSMRH